jgi:hypothetical protein
MSLKTAWVPTRRQVEAARSTTPSCETVLVGNPYMFFPRSMQSPELDNLVLDIHEFPACYDDCVGHYSIPSLNCIVCRIFFPPVDAGDG